MEDPVVKDSLATAADGKTYKVKYYSFDSIINGGTCCRRCGHGGRRRHHGFHRLRPFRRYVCVGRRPRVGGLFHVGCLHRAEGLREDSCHQAHIRRGVASILILGEPLNASIILGLTMTIAGLLLSQKGVYVDGLRGKLP